ncbi:allantoate amidohydrolase [Aggregatilineales bacterium SYSU G02658]
MPLPIDPAFQMTFEARIAALAALSESSEHLVRPSFTPSMRRVNALVSEWMAAAGLTPREDALGNLIGRYEGATPDAPALMIGSHLDTVADAGRYDGTLGVLLGLAVVEHLNAAGLRLPFAVEVIAFCDEEGLRFHLPYLGSRAVNGTLTAAHLDLTDDTGVSVAEALRLFGGSPEAAATAARRPDELIAYLEAHIEQGPALEAADEPLGVVTAIAGQHRAQLTFVGEAGHAGTVPMRLRRDALVTAARFVAQAYDYAAAVDGLVATVGQLSVQPGASNAIPGRVTLSLDVRHAEDAQREQATAALRRAAEEGAAAGGCQLEWLDISITPAVTCSPRLVDVLCAAIASERPPLRMVSGAGHDAAQMARLAPMAMLFVRCKGGLSHHPNEFCAAVDAEAALRALLGAVLALASA